MNNRKHYLLLEKLFRYPSDNFAEEVQHCQSFLDSVYPEAGKELKIFTDHILKLNQDEREELFIKTFDVQPICYLDLGYVMFGEDYKRGAFLLSMQHEQQKIGNDCGTDLPDNICNVLTLMTKSDNDAFVEDMVWRIFIPCVKKMIAEFGTARVDLKMKVLKKMHRAIIQEELNHGNVYKQCFLALLEVLRKDFGEKTFVTENDNVLSSSHHKAFFGKLQPVTEQPINEIVNNYKLD